MGYDDWLEAPYQRAAVEAEGFERFCEDYGFDFDDPEAEREFENWQEAMEDQAAEAKRERQEERDREEWENRERRL